MRQDVRRNVMRRTISICFVYLLMFLASANGQSLKRVGFINPTGTYELITHHTTDSTGVVWGYSGEIRVRLLDSSRIAVGFLFDEGGYAHHTGEFVDTLAYKNNVAVYTCPEDDSTCVLTLTFLWYKVVAVEQTDDYNWGCGFGQGVNATGIFKRVSSKPPKSLEPQIQLDKK